MAQSGGSVPVELALADLDGVVRALLLTEFEPPEAQLFVEPGTDAHSVRERARRVLDERGYGAVEALHVFELRTPSSTAAEAGGPEPGPVRPLIDGIALLADRRGHRETRVALTLNGRQAEATAPATSTRAVAAGAAAALNAVSELFDLEPAPAVGQATISESEHGPVVMVVVEWAGERLVGAVLAAETPVHEAAVRAALDALNRRLGRVLAAREADHPREE